VHHHVALEVALVSKTFSTSWFSALVWFNACVRQLVSVEGVLTSETFSTFSALIRFLPCVHRHMALEVAL